MPFDRLRREREQQKEWERSRRREEKEAEAWRASELQVQAQARKQREEQLKEQIHHYVEESGIQGLLKALSEVAGLGGDFGEEYHGNCYEASRAWGEGRIEEIHKEIDKGQIYVPGRFKNRISVWVDEHGTIRVIGERTETLSYRKWRNRPDKLEKALESAYTAGSQKIEPSCLLLYRKIATVTKPPVRILRSHGE
jgi:hypothetical protein